MIKNKSSNGRLYRRLVGELRMIKKSKNSKNDNELCGIEINPTDDMMIWIARIKGPENSPFEKGVYDILIQFNDITCCSNYQTRHPFFFPFDTVLVLVLVLLAV